MSSSPESYGAPAKAGRPEDTIASLQESVRLAPGDAQSQHNLGTALARSGRLHEAIDCFHRAVELKPRHAPTHNNLGETLRRVGRVEEAVAWLRRAIQLRPSYAEAHNNLGIALFEQGSADQALVSYRTALSIKPGYAEAHNNLGNALRDQGLLAEASVSLLQALKLQPGFAEAQNNLGLVLREQNRLEEARARFEEALRLKPTYLDARCNLGSLLQDLGELEQAAACFRDVLRQDPKHSAALALLATLLRGKLDNPDLKRLHERLADPFLTAEQRCGLHFGLGHVLDGRGEYPQAAVHMQQANALERGRWHKRGRAYDPAENAHFVDRLMRAFTREFFDRTRGWGSTSQRPVFIFGMPRSGTTLLEQILASHSQVHGGGELNFGHEDFDALAEMVGVAEGSPARKCELALEALEHLDRASVLRLAHRHLGALNALNASAARVTSKMPANWLFVGLLATLFPRATFVHCRRDSRDVALSCWMTRFQHLNWTCDPDHLVARFRDYHRLMVHWRVSLPVPMLEIDYEETVADLEGTARRLLSSAGLEWEPACLEFHKTSRPIRTASAVQVRQPLYRSSVARWRHYADSLGALFHRLEAER